MQKNSENFRKIDFHLFVKCDPHTINMVIVFTTHSCSEKTYSMIYTETVAFYFVFIPNHTKAYNSTVIMKYNFYY